jgi:hypothetical protein
MVKRHLVSLFALLLSIILITACAAPVPAATPVPTTVPTTAPTPNPLAGGILATFELNDQEFRVWVTNPDTIQQILDLRDGKSGDNIPNGKILRGPGPGDYNAPWSWHLDPQEIEMAFATMEVCDAEPNYVEENVDEFVDVVTRYCPWSAKLISVEDFR